MTGHSDRLNALAAALAKAQGELRSAEPNATGFVGSEDNGRSYRYATLSSVWDVVRPVLTKFGLSVVQTCEPAGRGELRLTTTLLHESGQWVSGTELVPMPVQSPRGFGSALTYARRYGLAAMVGVCVDDDDDAAAATPATIGQTHAAEPARPTAAGRSTDNRVREPATRRPPKAAASSPPAEAWRQVAYNRANQGQLKAFAAAYAHIKGVDVVGMDDLRRDCGVPGKLSDYFGDTPLGRILENATSNGPWDRGSGAPEPVREPVAEPTDSDGVGAQEDNHAAVR